MICTQTKHSGYGSDGRRLYHKGGGGGGTSTTTQEIPAELKPLASAYTDKAINLSAQGYTPYSGQRYADLNAIQGQGITDIVNRAAGGSDLVNTAESNLSQLMAGGSNPYLDQAVQRAQDSVKSNFTTGAVQSGSFGNANLMDQYQKNLGDVAGQMYGQAYDADQNRRLNAIAQAPTIANQAYTDANQLLNAGQILQDQSQQQKDFDYSQFQEQQNLPYKQLAAMSGVFGTNLGGSSTTKQSDGGGK